METNKRKRIPVLLLAAVLAAGLCGCAERDALAMGAALAESMEGQALFFSFELQFARERDGSTRTLRGAGTATGLIGGEAELEAGGWVEHREKTDADANSRRPSSFSYRVSETDYKQIHCRNGVLYIADAVREGFALPPANISEIELSGALRDALAGGADIAGVSNVGVSAAYGGRVLRCEIAAGSELGDVIGALFVALDDGTFGASTSADVRYRAALTTEATGRFAQLELTVERSTRTRDYEIVFTLSADGYDDRAEPFDFPGYVK